MGRFLVSQKLVDRSPDLKRLRDEGCDVNVIAGPHLLMGSIPYVNAERQVKTDGMIVCNLELNQDRIKQPDDHTVYFVGELPCDQTGAPLENIIINRNRFEIVKGLFVSCQFSTKPQTNNKHYVDYHDKMTTYAKIIASQAQAIDRSVKFKIFKPIAADEDETIFKYYDTSSSRAGITALSTKLEIKKLAIVGVGGTGSYVLDLVAKTRVEEIHLYDDDEFFQHNAFRMPGAVAFEDLRPGLKKVEHFAKIYEKLRNGIVPHIYKIDDSNINELRAMNFVFLCMDSGEYKDLIMKTLEDANIRFIDVGMGVYLADDAIGGILRVTSSTERMRAHIRELERVSLAPARGDNLYSRNIQVADLNCINAALAVLKWKKMCGFYLDLKREHHSTYMIETNKLSSEDRV